MILNKRIVGAPIRKWKRLFKLDGWVICARFETGLMKDGDVVHAFVTVDRSINQASISFNPDAIDDLRELDRVVAHELLHVVFSEVDGLLETLGPTFERITTDAMEGAIDKVVDALGDL